MVVFSTDVVIVKKRAPRNADAWVRKWFGRLCQCGFDDLIASRGERGEIWVKGTGGDVFALLANVKNVERIEITVYVG